MVLKLGHIRLVDHVMATTELRKVKGWAAEDMCNLCGGNAIVDADSTWCQSRVEKTVALAASVPENDALALHCA